MDGVFFSSLLALLFVCLALPADYLLNSLTVYVNALLVLNDICCVLTLTNYGAEHGNEKRECLIFL